MTIVLLQQDIVWQNRDENIDRADAAINASESADVYLLPEMWNTGFITNPSACAEEISQSKTLRWMINKAKSCNAAICGSLIIKEEACYYNRCYFVQPNGEMTWYNKRHLFTYAGEHLHYTKGHERVVVSFRGFRFMLQICYDLRFPVFSRNRKDYDVLLYVANWPHSRRDVWDLLLRARAIENQSYVVGVNRVGDDPTSAYSGGSVAYNAYGKIIAQCADTTSCSVAAHLNIEELRQFRTKFPVLDDAD